MIKPEKIKAQDKEIKHNLRKKKAPNIEELKARVRAEFEKDELPAGLKASDDEDVYEEDKKDEIEQDNDDEEEDDEEPKDEDEDDEENDDEEEDDEENSSELDTEDGYVKQDEELFKNSNKKHKKKISTNKNHITNNNSSEQTKKAIKNEEILVIQQQVQAMRDVGIWRREMVMALNNISEILQDINKKLNKGG